ncbi:hypothetical protein Tco_0778340 [Tanacetum coccineum]
MRLNEYEGIPKAEKKFKQLASDEEMARKLQEDWETEEERKKEREQFTVDDKCKVPSMIQLQLKDEFLAEQELFVIRNKNPTRNLRVKDPDQKSLKKRVVKETPKIEDTAKVPAKVEVTEQGTKKRKGGHIKMIARKRKRPQPDVNSDDEH